MKAAIVTSFDGPPTYGDFPEPESRAGEVLVTVHAAAVTRLVKGQVSGAHYSHETKLPLVPGADGVGRLADGRRVYVAFPRAPYGTMAERTVAKRAYCVAIPDALDDVTAAALGNPGMSSWAALTERAHFKEGESVLINGATGASGRLAVQIAKYRGAKHVVATGRNRATLASLSALGADAVVPLDGEPPEITARLRQAMADAHVDIVLDYLWGTPAACILDALSGKGTPEGERRIRFVQIGSMAGNTIPLSAAAFRSTGVELLGSGLGSVSWERLLVAVDGVMKAAVPGHFAVATEAYPIDQITRVWDLESTKRTVLTLRD